MRRTIMQYWFIVSALITPTLPSCSTSDSPDRDSKPKSDDAISDGQQSKTNTGDQSSKTTSGEKLSTNGTQTNSNAGTFNSDFISNFSLQPASFYLSGSSALKVSSLAEITSLISQGCSQSEIGHYKYFLDTYFHGVVCVPYSGPNIVTTPSPTYYQALDKAKWMNVHIGTTFIPDFIGFYMAKDSEDTSWEMMQVYAFKNASEQSITGDYLSLKTRNTFGQSPSSTSGISSWVSSQTLSSGPYLFTSSSLKTSQNFGQIKVQFSSGVTPSITSTVGSQTRPINLISIAK